jgi:hypothetical protein
MPSFFLLRWGLTNVLLGLVLNLSPPDLHLPNSWDYSPEPLHLAHRLLGGVFTLFCLWNRNLCDLSTDFKFKTTESSL